MRILLEMRHPAHFHHFKHFIWEMQERGHVIKVLAVYKDILQNLLNQANLDHVCIGENRKGLYGKITAQASLVAKVARISCDFNPDLLIGRPFLSIALTGWLLRKPRIIFAEDDFSTVLLAGLAAYPFAKDVLTPTATDLGIFEYKKIGYLGYQKLAYLHPNYFSPDLSKVCHLIKEGKPYYLLRFSGLDAHHDLGVKGLEGEVVQKIIEILLQRGNVYISTERDLDPDLEPYRLPINTLDIHHAMYFADLLISDSQSMSFEAAMLGLPSIRFNDFAGRIKVLEELEHVYGLTYGVKTTEPDRLFAKLEELLETPGIKEESQRRCQRMLEDKIDVTAFMIWFAEHYPESAHILRNDSEYQLQFKNWTATAVN